MTLSNFVGVAFVILLLAPGVTTPSAVGISAGDSVVYSYNYVTTYASGNGANITTTVYNQFTLGIVSANASAGEVEYTITVNEVNSSTVTTQTAVTNVTTIFNPYDNESYLGNIGFYPFTYTDLQAGTAKDLPISLRIRGIPGVNGTVSGGTMRINATVKRTPESIDINYTIFNIPMAHPILTVLIYNATTGLLYSWKEDAYALNVEKIFTYQLIGYSQPWRPDLSIILYIALAVIVVAAVYSVATRGTRRERKVARMKKRMERPG